MPNTIKAQNDVYRADEQVIVKVELEAAHTDDFAWAVLADEAGELAVVHQAVIDRSKPPAPTDYTIPVPVLPPGSYHVRLYLRDPRKQGRKGQQVHTWQLTEVDPYEDEDSFAVAEEPGNPVMLVARGLHPRRLGKGLANYDDFETFVVQRSKRLDPKRGKAYGNFGRRVHEELYDLAFEYVESIRCRSLADLAPPGYLLDRQKAEALLPVTFRDRPFLPCVELIWNYFEEEAGLVQTLNVILARFQNRRVSPHHDPLGRFDVTPLLPLRNLLWGWAEDEARRTTVRRRVAEYAYEYGIVLVGRAVPPSSTFVESRASFLESFHQVIHQAHLFYKERDDLTVNADPFPLYQAIRDCHLSLSYGTHNQYGEMAVAARAEFLVMQFLLRQPQMRDFLGGRPMTPYPEPWMDRVDTMRSIQGWGDASVMHFHDLATISERLVLTLRLGGWSDVNVGANEAGAWADAFRPDIQRYAAAYRAVTGVDLARSVDATMPSLLISRRARAQRLRA
jgi:hypothetical protein